MMQFTLESGFLALLGLLRLRVAANESDKGDFVRAEFHGSNLYER